MAKKQFKAESKRLMDLMINSIYTNQEIFLRELISNASDAEDKLYFKTLQDGISGLSRSDFEIRLEPNKEARTLTITDNGIGMTQEELDKNLGTIAKSGSRLFKEENKDNEDADKDGEKDIDIIGQFGVGFYSAFMVAKEVVVTSKAYGADEAYQWKSTGVDGYTVTPCEKDGHGTTITMTLKDDTDDNQYSQYLETYVLQSLVKKYSDYIRYPIKMNVTTSRLKEGTENEYEDITEEQTLNTMSPIWKKQRSEVTEEEYNEFYKENFYDYTDPLKTIRSSTEGAATYTALLYIPSRKPVNYYTKDFEKGLKLYASGVLIMDNCKDLLPDHFSFVRGLVDSEDLSLNISREMLQQDRQLRIIETHLEKKIKNELLAMLRKDRENYETFWKEFGTQIKFGIYSSYGQQAANLQDLLLFLSSNEGKYTTLDEYTDRMREEQKYIYYACGESADQIAKLPQAERVLDAGYEILYLTEEVDEFTLKMMNQYKDHEFRSISDDDLGLDTDDEKEQQKKVDEENKDLFTFMQESLGDRVVAVRSTTRLKSHPVCFSTEGPISLEMEKVLLNQPGNEEAPHAQKVLELNASHPMFEKLKALYAADDKDKVKTYTELLYGQALLIEGLPIDDPVAFANEICTLM